MKKIFLVLFVMMLGLVGAFAAPHRNMGAPPLVSAIAADDAVAVVPTVAIVPDFIGVLFPARPGAALGDPGILSPTPQVIIDTGPSVPRVMTDKPAESYNYRKLPGARLSVVMAVDYALLC